MFSEEELICAAVLLDEEKGKSWKRKCVHESSLQRKEGKYFTLYKELVEDSVRFHQYFRMSKSTYLNLLSLIEEDLMKKNNTFREAISSREKSAICFR
jgi:hypothetical protein